MTEDRVRNGAHLVRAGFVLPECSDCGLSLYNNSAVLPAYDVDVSNSGAVYGGRLFDPVGMLYDWVGWDDGDEDEHHADLDFFGNFHPIEQVKYLQPVTPDAAKRLEEALLDRNGNIYATLRDLAEEAMSVQAALVEAEEEFTDESYGVLESKYDSITTEMLQQADMAASRTNWLIHRLKGGRQWSP